MKLKDGFWVDANQNRWSAAAYSEIHALAFSATLIDCRDCTNCRDCSYCSHCRDCSYCSHCRGCSYCANCKDCSQCNSFCKNPERIIGSVMGSRSANPAVYWIEVGKEQCVVGCFRGTLDELEQAVEKTHKDNEKYLNEYKNFIAKVRAYQGVPR